jgi:transcriptional regulator with XRE-family HTH domain
MTKTPDEAAGTPSIIGSVVRALRIARGIGVNQLGNAIGLEPSNLSRFERGLPGGVHTAKYLDQIASKLGTSASILYVVSEITTAKPEILQEPAELLKLVDRLTLVVRKYLQLSAKKQEEVKRFIEELE